ncbi:MAG: hypothetical protein K2Y22_13400 [Candidatus Obscuribacterales bacterium]|nr:hypothetical protein [Candidatus Obscuribacterales bacterium]
MVSEISNPIQSGAEVWIPEFGMFDTMYLEPDKKYQGRLYRISPDSVRMMSELLGFTARFDAITVRSAYVDVVKTEGHAAFEIDRNTKPTDIGLRYSRDRWTGSDSTANQGEDRLRPWLTTFYEARFLPEKTLSTLAEHLRINAEDLVNFYVRINLKDRIAGLIAEDSQIEAFPSGAFSVFALPEGHVAVIPLTEIADNANQPAKAAPAPQFASSYATSEPGPKYATYSKSEIDLMLKQNADNLANALSGKISALQRSVQDASASQEKSFAKVIDKFTSQVDEARTKIDATSKSAQETTHKELDQFGKHLEKELEQFRSQINKNIAPLSKTVDDKVKMLESISKAGPAALAPIIKRSTTIVVVAVVISAALAVGVLMPQIMEISSLRSQVTSLTEKVDKLNTPAPVAPAPAETKK